MDTSFNNSANISSDESVLSHNNINYSGDSNFNHSIDKSQTLRILNPTSHSNASHDLESDDNDDEDDDSDEPPRVKKFKLNNGSSQLMQTEDNDNDNDDDDDDATNKDSKKLNKIQRQQRLKKRLLSELRMSDNEDFDFEEQELLHSKRSFRDRQRIDYNENKKPTKSSSSTSTSITTTPSSKSNSHSNINSSNSKATNSVSSHKHLTRSSASTRTPSSVQSVILRLGKREKPLSSSSSSHKKAILTSRKSKKSKKRSPLNARGADGKFLKRSGRSKNQKIVENEILELTDDTTEDWDSDSESESTDSNNEVDKTHPAEFDFEEDEEDEREDDADEQEADVEADVEEENKVKEFVDNGTSSSPSYYDAFEKKSNVSIHLYDDKVDKSFVNSLVERDMASKLTSLANPDNTRINSNLPKIKIEEIVEADAESTLATDITDNYSESHEFDQLGFLETPEDLENYQKLLTSEYSKLSQDFANSTTTRIDELVDLIDLTIGKTKTDYSNFKKRVESSRENIKHKRFLVSNSKKSKHSKNPSDNLITQDALDKFRDPRPMDFPIFHGFFEDHMKPKFNMMEAIKKRSKYDLGLIESETLNNVTIIELQLQRAMQENREAMKEQILRDLDHLNLEFYDRAGIPLPKGNDEFIKLSSLNDDFKKTLLLKSTDSNKIANLDKLNRQFEEGDEALDALASLVSSVSQNEAEIAIENAKQVQEDSTKHNDNDK